MKEIKSSYLRENGIYRQIAKHGFAEYVNTLKDLPAAFEQKQNSICCMDEGTPWGRHAAGGGILMSPEELEQYYRQIKPDEITSHDNCGAVGIYAQKNGIPARTADGAGKQWAKNLAKKLGIKHRHIRAKEMARPPEGHFARSCYFDLLGSFNYCPVPGLPAGFVVSRKFMTANYALKEVELALSIAFGKHGPGNRISRHNPFYLVAVADNKDRLTAAKKALAKPARVFEDKIKIDGFVKPFV